MKKTLNPLTRGDLDGAAYLCLKAAALTDRDQFPLGSGDLICRQYHERKRRFEKASSRMENGATSLSELGLLLEDCVWAASQACRAKDVKGWQRRFQTAKEKLAKISSK